MRQTYTAAEVAKLKKIWTKQLAMALQENEKLRMELRGLVQETSTRANQLSNHCGNVDRMMLCLPIYNHKTLPHAPRTQG